MGLKGLLHWISPLLVSATIALSLLWVMLTIGAGGGGVIEAGEQGPAHQGYDTLGGFCKHCHSIDENQRNYESTAKEWADAFCVTCHLPKVPRPDARLLFPKNRGSGAGITLGGLHKQSAPSKVRKLLNNIGSGVSVYQDDPDRIVLSGHDRALCLDCHSAHTLKRSQIKDSRGGIADTKVLKSAPSTAARLFVGKTPIVLDNWAADGARWCRGCHRKKGSEGHNHPDYLCLQCHQDAVADSPPEAAQFPHNSEKPSLLSAEPGSLCLICHAKGTIP